MRLLNSPPAKIRFGAEPFVAGQRTTYIRSTPEEVKILPKRGSAVRCSLHAQQIRDAKFALVSDSSCLLDGRLFCCEQENARSMKGIAA